jgi:hypothetical protein
VSGVKFFPTMVKERILDSFELDWLAHCFDGSYFAGGDFLEGGYFAGADFGVGGGVLGPLLALNLMMKSQFGVAMEAGSIW